MKRYVKNLREFLTEALNKSEWLNYKNDTGLNTPDPSDDLSKTAALVQKLLNVDDPAQLLFTGDDVSISQDYKYFLEQVIPKSDKKEEGNMPDSGYTAYYALYQNGEKFFVKFDVKDSSEYSYIFIREEDYEYFDKLDAPMVPQLAEKPPQPETPAQAVPAQPGGGATGAPLL